MEVTGKVQLRRIALNFIKESLNKSSEEVVLLRLIGKEGDNLVIFLCHTSNAETYIFYFNIFGKLHARIAYKSSKVENIISASINTEIGIIAYVTVETGPKALYRTRIVELMTLSSKKKNVFSGILPSNCDTYVQLQFVRSGEEARQLIEDRRTSSGNSRDPSPTTIVSKGTSEKSVAILVCHLGGKLDVYQIPYAFTATGLFLGGRVAKDTVLEDVKWIQWDSYNRRVFAIYNNQTSYDMRCSLFTAFQFFEVGEQSCTATVFRVDLDFVYPEDAVFQPMAQFAVNHTVSFIGFNASVLTHGTGLVCLCVEKPLWSVDDDFPLYKAFFLHAGKVVACAASDGMINIPVCFTLHGNSFVVISPYFIHLINTSIYTETLISLIIPYSLFNKSKVVVHLPTSRTSTVVFDVECLEVLTLKANMESCLMQLKNTKSKMNRLAILNYLILSGRESDYLREAFQIVCSSPRNPEVPQLVLEYLVSSTHAQFTKNASREYHPFIRSTTVEEHLREQLYIEALGEEVLLKIIIYPTPVHSLQFQTANYSKQRLNDTLWRQFCEQVRWHELHSPLQGFLQQNTRSLKQSSPAIPLPTKDTKPRPRSESSSFIGRLMSSFSISRQKRPSVAVKYNPNRTSARSEAIFGHLPFFLEEPILSPEQTKLMEAAMFDFLNSKEHTKYLPHEWQKPQIIAEYISCLSNQIRLLFHIVYSILGDHIVQPDDVRLNGKADDRDYNFHQMLSNVLLVMREEGFPIPNGVEGLFLRLAFRCLPRRTFLQNLRHRCFGSFDQAFTTELLALPGSANYLGELKEEVLSTFPPELKVSTLFREAQPSLKRELIAEYSESLYSTVGPDTRQWDLIASRSQQDAASSPVTAFLKHLQDVETHLRQPKVSVSFGTAFVDFGKHKD